MESSRGRPKWPEPVTPAEAKVLELVRQRLSNAEIAMQLSVSINTVRYHVSNLLAKAGAGSRDELAEWQPNRRDRHLGGRLAPVVPLLAKALFAAVGVALVASVTVIASANFRSGHRTLSPTITAGLRYETVDSDRYVDEGRLFTVAGHETNPVIKVDERAAMTVVTLAGPGAVHFAGPSMSNPSLQTVLNGVIYGQGSNGHGLFDIQVQAGDSNTVVDSHVDLVDELPIAVTTKAGGQPVVMVWATTTNGSGQSTEGLRPIHPIVEPSGELLLAVNTIPLTTVINRYTGQALDVSNARQLMTLQGYPTTGCEPGGFCSVALTPGAFRAPSDGIERCVNGSTFEFDDGATGIRFRAEPFNGEPALRCPSSLQAVAQGTEVVDGYYNLEAVNSAGQPISLAVAGNNLLYAGGIAAAVGCPCLPGT